MMSYYAKLTGEDISHYLNKIESIGLSLVLESVGDLTVSVAKCLHFLPYIMAARAAGIDGNVEITSLSFHVSSILRHFWLVLIRATLF